VILAGSLVLVPIVLAVSVIAATLYQGMVVNLVSDVQDGRRDSTIEELVRTTGPVVLPLIGAGLLAGIAIGIGFLLLIVPGLILLTIWSVIAPVIVVEHSGVMNAFGRSRELVRGNGWQVFGAIVVACIIVATANVILGAIGVAISDAAVSRIVFSLIRLDADGAGGRAGRRRHLLPVDRDQGGNGAGCSSAARLRAVAPVGRCPGVGQSVPRAALAAF
jgi:hypothetical protein